MKHVTEVYRLWSTLLRNFLHSSVISSYFFQTLFLGVSNFFTKCSSLIVKEYHDRIEEDLKL
jgi:hypothetical protein